MKNSCTKLSSIENVHLQSHPNSGICYPSSFNFNSPYQLIGQVEC